MVATVLQQAGYAGTWVGALSRPSQVVGRPTPSLCSKWVAGLVPVQKRQGLKPVSLHPAQNRRSGSESGFARRFGCDKVTRQHTPAFSRVLASSGGGDEVPGDFETFSIDRKLVEGEDYQVAKGSYIHKAGLEVFQGCEELFPPYEKQHVLGHGKINTADGVILVPSIDEKDEESPVQVWDLVKRAPGVIAAAVFAGYLFWSNSGPAKAPTMQETASYRRSVSSPNRIAPAARRGRNNPRNLQTRQDEQNPLMIPSAVLASAALVVTLLKNKSSDKDKALPKPVEDPTVTVLHLHLGVLGTATSLRMDLEDICAKPVDGIAATPDSLKETAQRLLKNLEHIPFARKQIGHAPNNSTGRTYFRNYIDADKKGQGELPTLDMLAGIKKGYGHKGPKEKEMPFVDYYKTGYTVVTLTCSLKGRLHGIEMKDTEALLFWLRQLELADPKDVVDVKLQWGPTAGETMPEDIMHKYYPHMELLAREEDLAEIEKVGA